MKFVSCRSLSRSIDETNEVKSDGITIKDGLLGDIISKIEAKIRNYEDMIEVVKSGDTDEDMQKEKQITVLSALVRLLTVQRFKPSNPI